MTPQTSHGIIVIDAMEGVRAGIRWLLQPHPDLQIVAEASSISEAATRVGTAQVVLSGLLLPDGTAADLVDLGLPVVVHTWLPSDERPAKATLGCAAVLRHGSLRTTLAAAVRSASILGSGPRPGHRGRGV